MTEDTAFRATARGAAYTGIERLPVTVLLDNVRSLYNVGAFFRTADAVRAEAIVLAGITPTPQDPRIAKTSLGAERTVPWSKTVDSAQAVDSLRAGGREIAAIETSLHAVDLFDWRPRFPVCVVFGHEVDGIAPAVLERCDVHVRIPTLGAKGSINVATAGGVVLYELLRKYRGLIPGSKDPGLHETQDPGLHDSMEAGPSGPANATSERGIIGAMTEDDAPKSAYELAMERLRKKDAETGAESKPITDEQRAAIAEVRNFYEAKAAEVEVLHQSSMRKTAEPDARTLLEEQYRRDRERLNSERDSKIERIRRGGA